MQNMNALAFEILLFGIIYLSLQPIYHDDKDIESLYAYLVAEHSVRSQDALKFALTDFMK